MRWNIVCEIRHFFFLRSIIYGICISRYNDLIVSSNRNESIFVGIRAGFFFFLGVKPKFLLAYGIFRFADNAVTICTIEMLFKWGHNMFAP